MAKPIALYHYPDWLFDEAGGVRKPIVDVIKAFNHAMPDYYWLCFPSAFIKFPKLQVYFEKDMEEIEYDELVELIKKKIAKVL